MRADSQQEQIRRVLAICKDRWRADGASEGRIEAMSRELEEELRYATEDGETIKEVVGPDVERFAKLWAEEDRPPDSLKDRLMVVVLVVAMFLIVAASLAARFTPLLGSWWSWYLIVTVSILAAAVVLFLHRRSR